MALHTQSTISHTHFRGSLLFIRIVHDDLDVRVGEDDSMVNPTKADLNDDTVYVHVCVCLCVFV